MSVEDTHPRLPPPLFCFVSLLPLPIWFGLQPHCVLFCSFVGLKGNGGLQIKVCCFLVRPQQRSALGCQVPRPRRGPDRHGQSWKKQDRSRHVAQTDPAQGQVLQEARQETPQGCYCFGCCCCFYCCCCLSRAIAQTFGLQRTRMGSLSTH